MASLASPAASTFLASSQPLDRGPSRRSRVKASRPAAVRSTGPTPRYFPSVRVMILESEKRTRPRSRRLNSSATSPSKLSPSRGWVPGRKGVLTGLESGE